MAWGMQKMDDAQAGRADGARGAMGVGLARKAFVAAMVCAALLSVALCAGCATKGQATASDAAKETPEASLSLVNGVTNQQEVVYCLYFGLNDKDTGKQKLTMDEAKSIIIPLFVEAGSGYTVYEAEGGYATDGGTVVQNETLVFDSVHGDEQAIITLIDKAKQALNIESVYCESRAVGYGIFGGVVTDVQ